MPVFEMSLAQLQEYQGRNPRPADVEEYWDKALVEMRAVGGPAQRAADGQL